MKDALKDLSLASPVEGEVTKGPLIYTQANLQEFRKYEYGRNRVKRYERQKTEPNRDPEEKNIPEGIQIEESQNSHRSNRDGRSEIKSKMEVVPALSPQSKTKK